MHNPTEREEERRTYGEGVHNVPSSWKGGEGVVAHDLS